MHLVYLVHLEGVFVLASRAGRPLPLLDSRFRGNDGKGLGLLAAAHRAMLNALAWQGAVRHGKVWLGVAWPDWARHGGRWGKPRRPFLCRPAAPVLQSPWW